MNSRQFFSTNTNIFDESFNTSAPTNLNGQNVIVSQEQQRKLFDTLSTAIMGFPSNTQYATNCFCPGNSLQAQKQFVPGGVAFSFNTGQPFFTQMQFPNNQPQFNNTFAPNPQCYPQPLQQHIMVGSLQPNPQQQLDAMQYKLMPCQKGLTEIMDVRQYDNQNIQPSWKFHKNVGTTSDDLLNYHTQIPGSKSTPDFSNISGIDPQAPAICHSNDVSKKIILSKPIEKPKGHVSDILDGENEKKTVSFNDEKEKCPCDEEVNQMIDKSVQVSLFTCCCSSESSESVSDSDCEDTDKEIEKLYSSMEEELFCDHCRQLLQMMKSRSKNLKGEAKENLKITIAHTAVQVIKIINISSCKHSWNTYQMSQDTNIWKIFYC